MKKEPILVIASMEDVELDYLKKKLENIKIEKNEMCPFIEGKIGRASCRERVSSPV